MLIFPEDVRFRLGAVISSSSTLTRSSIRTFVLITPSVTNSQPLLSGRVLTVPFSPRLMTLTISPIFRSFTVRFPFSSSAGLIPFTFFESLSMRERSSARSCSISRVFPPRFAYQLIVLSAYSFASCRIFLASSEDSDRMSRFRLVSFASLSFSALSRRSISMRACAAAAFSCSSSARCFSSPEMTSSKDSSCVDRWDLALSISSSGRPSFLEMANALLFPGTPIRSR